MLDYYDVIIVGGGHAGCEAALASARMGASTLLLTQNIETLGQMSCNPAIGGLGKSHLVKEIDALGGVMAHAADKAGIHFRVLNARKGPAVRATRVQADRMLYKNAIRSALENQKNLMLFQQSVEDLVVEKDSVVGVLTQMGLIIRAASVVLTVGTFLGGKIHMGTTQIPGGRAGDAPSLALANRLRALPFRVARLKTGTPPRIDARSLDYSYFQEQPGDTPRPVFSFLGSVDDHPSQVSCFIAKTTEKTHDIIRENLAKAPIFSGQIEGVGPRYCPSIEDKIVRFSDKQSHQIFIEPEGLQVHEIYPNGISTSLPFSIQQAFVRSIPGFSRAHITRPGYAIEYDFFDPRDLTPWLETKILSRLFFAGQINGTTGYEEAAAQGLIAGANAALQAAGKSPWFLRRDQAYIGVLIDDLITQGTQEPYRMFTSRAEHRLFLREDNADLRLTQIGYELGLVPDTRWQDFYTKKKATASLVQWLQDTIVRPYTELAQAISAALPEESRTLTREYRFSELLKRPELCLLTLQQEAQHKKQQMPPNSYYCAELETINTYPESVIQQAQTQIKYAGYVDRQHREVAQRRQEEARTLPIDLDYKRVPGLSTEVQQRLSAARPHTLGQAARLPGVTPAAVSLLLVYLTKKSMA